MIPTVSNNKFIYKPVTIQHDQGLNVYWQGRWQNIPDGDVSMVEPATNVTVSENNPITIEVTPSTSDWYLYNMHLNNFSKIERLTSSLYNYYVLYYNNTYATDLQLSTPYSGYVQFLAEGGYKISITADSIVDIKVYCIKSEYIQ